MESRFVSSEARLLLTSRDCIEFRRLLAPSVCEGGVWGSSIGRCLGVSVCECWISSEQVSTPECPAFGTVKCSDATLPSWLLRGLLSMLIESVACELGTTPPPIRDQNICSRNRTLSSQAAFSWSSLSARQWPSLTILRKPRKSQVDRTRPRQYLHKGCRCADSVSFVRKRCIRK